jgi:hypothetical protein
METKVVPNRNQELYVHKYNLANRILEIARAKHLVVLKGVTPMALANQFSSVELQKTYARLL